MFFERISAGQFSLFEHRHIGVFGDVNANGTVFTGVKVISFQRPPQYVGLYAYDGIDIGVIVRPAAEHLGRHGVILDFKTFAGQGNRLGDTV